MEPILKRIIDPHTYKNYVVPFLAKENNRGIDQKRILDLMNDYRRGDEANGPLVRQIVQMLNEYGLEPTKMMLGFRFHGLKINPEMARKTRGRAEKIRTEINWAKRTENAQGLETVFGFLEREKEHEIDEERLHAALAASAPHYPATTAYGQKREWKTGSPFFSDHIQYVCDILKTPGGAEIFNSAVTMLKTGKKNSIFQAVTQAKDEKIKREMSEKKPISWDLVLSNPRADEARNIHALHGNLTPSTWAQMLYETEMHYPGSVGWASESGRMEDGRFHDGHVEQLKHIIQNVGIEGYRELRQKLKTGELSNLSQAVLEAIHIANANQAIDKQAEQYKESGLGGEELKKNHDAIAQAEQLYGKEAAIQALQAGFRHKQIPRAAALIRIGISHDGLQELVDAENMTDDTLTWAARHAKELGRPDVATILNLAAARHYWPRGAQRAWSKGVRPVPEDRTNPHFFFASQLAEKSVSPLQNILSQTDTLDEAQKRLAISLAAQHGVKVVIAGLKEGHRGEELEKKVRLKSATRQVINEAYALIQALNEINPGMANSAMNKMKKGKRKSR